MKWTITCTRASEASDWLIRHIIQNWPAGMIIFTEYYNVVIIRIEARVHASRCRYSEGVTHFLGQGLNQPTYVIHSLYYTALDVV